MKNHTPGPWTVSYNPYGVHSYMIKSQKKRICDVRGNIERKCNAYLIAAAPEMLEALQWASALLNNSDALASHEQRREAEVRISAAIAKADGK